MDLLEYQGKQLFARHGVPVPSGRPASTVDEALDAAAEGFRSAVDRHGPDTFGMFSCSKATNEVNFIAQKFTRAVIGTNNIDSCNRT